MPALEKGTCPNHLKEFVCKLDPHNPPAKDVGFLSVARHLQPCPAVWHQILIWKGWSIDRFSTCAITSVGSIFRVFSPPDASGSILMHLILFQSDAQILTDSAHPSKPTGVIPLRQHLSQLPWVKSPAWMTKFGTIRWNFTPHNCTSTGDESC